MVESLDEYAWSSYPAFVGKIKKPEWLEIDWLLSGFGKIKLAIIRNYSYIIS
jgi:hypothetical protein